MLKSTETTLKFLLGISGRLSSRDDCRQVEYHVTIDQGRPTMDPPVYVFPNRYRRRESDKISIVEFVANDMRSKGYNLEFLTNGSYTYRNSIEKKQRRWVNDSESL